MIKQPTKRHVVAMVLAASTWLGCGEDPPAGAPPGGSNGSGNNFENNFGNNNSGDGGAGEAGVPPDMSPPVVTILSPADNELVGGNEYLIQATISDTIQNEQNGLQPVGVNEDSVRIVIKDKEVEKQYPVKKLPDGTYQTKFSPVREYAGRAQVTINVRAEDLRGNASFGEISVNLDTVRPFMTFDTGNVRTWRTSGKPGELVCSAPFDPLGKAANDGQVVPIQVLLRMLIWERGVDLNTGATVYYSGVDDANVRAYVQGNLDTPLLINTDSDPECDAVNFKPADESKKPYSLNFAPLPVLGTPSQADELGLDGEATAFGCKAATEAKRDKRLCTDTSDLVATIPHCAFGGKTPAVYAFMPTEGAGPDCTGSYWQMNTQLGWACVVGATRDRAGNETFSPPLRICFSEDDTCPSGPTPPSCTDGCTMPADLLGEEIKWIEK